MLDLQDTHGHKSLTKQLSDFMGRESDPRSSDHGYDALTIRPSKLPCCAFILAHLQGGVSLLLSRGADKTIRDHNGVLPVGRSGILEEDLELLRSASTADARDNGDDAIDGWEELDREEAQDELTKLGDWADDVDVDMQRLMLEQFELLKATKGSGHDN